MDGDEYRHYLNGVTPAEIAEHLKDILPDLGDLDVEEVLLQQESAFQFIENMVTRPLIMANLATSVFSEPESELSYGASMESQLALDEALAGALELEDDFNDLHISEPRGDSVGDTFHPFFKV